ncbi:MAG: hypothetical protein R3E83_08575 [Burkholderiaceae bacterium]
MLNDHLRRGLVRGCSLRLPAVIVRPGAANGAATGFSSAIWREPLAGRDYALPVPRQTRMWCASPAAVVDNLVHALSVPDKEWSPHSAVNLPGRVVSMQEAIDSLERVAVLAHPVRERLDPVITEMSTTWACEFETSRARKLGFRRDDSIDSMLRAYIDEHPDAVRVPLRDRRSIEPEV